MKTEKKTTERDSVGNAGKKTDSILLQIATAITGIWWMKAVAKGSHWLAFGSFCFGVMWCGLGNIFGVPMADFNIACGNDYMARLFNPWVYPFALCLTYALVCVLAIIVWAGSPHNAAQALDFDEDC